MLSTHYMNAAARDDRVDPLMVEQLIAAIGTGMERACIREVTTPAEILSALFTTLDRCLRGMSKASLAADQVYNRQEIGRVLADMIAELGAVRHLSYGWARPRVIGRLCGYPRRLRRCQH